MSRFFPVSQPSISDQELACVSDAVRSGWVSSIGKYIEEFETLYAAYCGTRYAIAVSNGTAALHLALASMDIRAGDEVIIPDLTFVATANAVTYTGATVVTVDIDEETLCLSPSALENAITPRTKAVIPVHLYGHPSDMTAINQIALTHGLRVVEDAAESHGAEFHGKRTGSLADCGVFSFYGNKIITTGEGGMITTDDEALRDRARYLRDHAMSPSKRYWHTMVGFNYRMTNIQAALGVAQMARIDAFTEKRRTIMAWYRKRLEGRKGLKLNRELPGTKNVFWMVCVEVEGLTEGVRATLMAELRKVGVDSRPYFFPVSDLPMYASADTPVAHRIAPIGMNLPAYYALAEQDVDEICHEVLSVLGRMGLE